jgi:hypothetical protein
MLPLANGEVKVAVVVVNSWPPTFSCTTLGVMLVAWVLPIGKPCKLATGAIKRNWYFLKAPSNPRW